MGQIVRSLACRIDLLQIGDHIAEHSPTAAIRMLDSIDARLQFLSDHPHAGQARPELGPDVRSFSAGAYVIFFQPLPDGINVSRVLHGSRDIDALF